MPRHPERGRMAMMIEGEEKRGRCEASKIPTEHVVGEEDKISI